MKAIAMHQPGYISSETLCELEHPGECLVISRWENKKDWNKWLQSQERAMINDIIKALTGEKTEYNIYSPMLPPTNAEKATQKQAECIAS